MEVVSTKVEGDWVEPFRQGNLDLDRVVVPFQSRMAPGDTITVEATFTGSGEFGPLDVWSTPMVRATELTVTDSCR
jgi:L-2-hydroxyglutarate oxidase LhgO